MMNFAQATPTPLPSPAEVVEILDKAERVISIWDSLGPLMAILAALTLAFVIIGVVVYFNRNNSSTAIEAQDKLIARQERDIADLKLEIREERGQYVETFKVIGDQLTRVNDLWEANNTQAGQRVSQQQRMLENQSQIAADLKSIATTGSPSVQHIKTKVDEVLEIATRLDDRTAPWDEIVRVLTPLLIELGVLRQKAKEHSTQPIPPVLVPESDKITIEGTMEGKIITGNGT